MVTKILCTKCGEVLREGSPGAVTEYKECISCVTKDAPASKKIIGPPMPNAASQIAEEIRKFNERLKIIHIEVVYKYIDDKICMVIEMADYQKTKFAEFGFPKEKLQEFIDTIEELEREKEEDEK